MHLTLDILQERPFQGPQKYIYVVKGLRSCYTVWRSLSQFRVSFKPRIRRNYSYIRVSYMPRIIYLLELACAWLGVVSAHQFKKGPYQSEVMNIWDDFQCPLQIKNAVNSQNHSIYFSFYWAINQRIQHSMPKRTGIKKQCQPTV